MRGKVGLFEGGASGCDGWAIALPAGPDLCFAARAEKQICMVGLDRAASETRVHSGRSGHGVCGQLEGLGGVVGG